MTFKGESFVQHLSSNWSELADQQTDYDFIRTSLESAVEFHEFRTHHKFCREGLSQCNMSIVNYGTSKPFHFYGVPSWTNCSHENKFFQRIMKRDVEQAIRDYNDSVLNVTQKVMSFNAISTVFPVSECDITIHMRCGDSVSIGQWYHPFHKFERYSQDISSAVQLYRERTGVDCSVASDHRQSHLNIISQFEKAGFNIDSRERNQTKIAEYCYQLIQDLGHALQTRQQIMVQGKYETRLVNNDINNDLWLMYQSPIAIFTWSTFPWTPRSMRGPDADHKVTIEPSRDWSWLNDQGFMERTHELRVDIWRRQQGLEGGEFNDSILLALEYELGIKKKSGV